MLNQLTVKNFRKHKNLNLNFQAGITVIRAPNEQGKSTLAEAVAYALFGARATRNSDISTWGERPNSHEVKLSLSAGNQDIHIKRSPSGAEITLPNQRITGQTDTARFMESQLDVPAGSGGKLMLVSQNEMRGVLSDGGAKSTQLIEQLADLKQIDHIINVLQENYHTGKTDLMQHTLGSLKAQHQQAQDEVQQRQTEVANDTQQVELATQQEQNLTQQREPLASRLNQLQQQQAQIVRQEKQLRDIEMQLNQWIAKREAAQAQLDQATFTFDDQELETAEQQLQTLLTQQVLYEDYQRAAHYAPEVWQENATRQSVQDDLKAADVQVNQLHTHIADTKAQINSLTRQINDQTVCPTCQREWIDLAARQAHQTHIQAQITQLQQTLNEQEQQCKQPEQTRQRLRKMLDVKLLTLPDNTLWQEATPPRFPPLFVWQGSNIPEAVPQASINEARQNVERCKQQQMRVAEQARTKQAAAEQWQYAQEQVQSVQEQYQTLKQSLPMSSQDLGREIDDLRRQTSDLELAIKDVQAQHQQAQQRLSAHQQRLAQLDTLLGSLKQEIQRYETELQQAQQASALLKLLRKLKPQIASQVWHKLCSSVSHYFSLMRGETSQVAHTTDGFQVDGHDSQSLSGSTLDILGLAIRVALVKTFMPTCDFLLLDEPFAAADSERTTNALGFLSTLGFAQVIIITHEDSTEAVADHLISL